MDGKGERYPDSPLFFLKLTSLILQIQEAGLPPLPAREPWDSTGSQPPHAELGKLS